jgi:hypothetical protein
MEALFKTSLALAALAACHTLAGAQSPAQATPRPFFSKPAGAAANQPPPREVRLVETPWDALSDKEPGEEGAKALTINPAKWKHAETPNFILHYRRATEAQKVAREVEYDLWYVATALGAGPERYQKKSHVFVFEDEEEWKQFKGLLNDPALSWSASFAAGDELFLNVRGGGNSGGGSSFDSHTLAHEATHAVVARLFPRKRWPLWLNEGFAEYMGGASVAARKGQSGKRYQRDLSSDLLTPAALESATSYPSDERSIQQFYESSEMFVRFLMSEAPKERFAKFIDAILAGRGMQAGVLEVYGDKFKDWDAFMKRYERFKR